MHIILWKFISDLRVCVVIVAEEAIAGVYHDISCISCYAFLLNSTEKHCSNQFCNTRTPA